MSIKYRFFIPNINRKRIFYDNLNLAISNLKPISYDFLYKSQRKTNFSLIHNQDFRKHTSTLEKEQKWNFRVSNCKDKSQSEMLL